MAAFTGLFKKFTGDTSETPAEGADAAVAAEAAVIPEDTEKGASETASSDAAGNGSGVAGIGSRFFSGTTGFLDSVSAKKDGLMSDISSKLGGLKLVSSGSKDGDDGGDSSASEYGDGGDQPFYAEEVPEERRGSMDSVDSLPENETKTYREFVTQLCQKVFDASATLTSDDKSQFTTYCQRHTARGWYAKEIQKEREKRKAVTEPVLTKLTDTMAIALTACNAAEDFGPSRLLMNACFTFYVDRSSLSVGAQQHYLYSNLKDQPIWQSLRFWNAAFFEAIQLERKRKPDHIKQPSGEDDEDAAQKEKEYHENLNFGQLSTFTWNMAALGLTKEICMEFLRKQANIASVSKDKVKLIRANITKWTSKN